MPAQYPRDIVYLSDEQIEQIAASVAAKVPPQGLLADQIEQIAQRTLELLTGQVMPITLADTDKEDIADLVIEKMKAVMAQADADSADEAPPFDAGGDHAELAEPLADGEATAKAD